MPPGCTTTPISPPKRAHRPAAGPIKPSVTTMTKGLAVVSRRKTEDGNTRPRGVGAPCPTTVDARLSSVVNRLLD